MRPSGIPALDALPLWNEHAPFDLETPRALCEALGNPQDSFRSVHVAGSNGKGTVCALIASMLASEVRSQQSGSARVRVGQFTSPHLSDVCERCLIDGAPINREIFTAAIDEVLACGIPASYFEVVTAATFLCFRESGVAWGVIEVGLGGRLDATNVLSKPELCVITSISLDHTHILGETEELIAEEKAGIFKEHVPVVVGDVSAGVKAVLKEAAQACSASIAFYGEGFSDIEALSSRELFSLNGGLHTLPSNFGLAAEAAKLLGCETTSIREGAERARWPGRFEMTEWVDNKRRSAVFLDCAHNPGGISKLLSLLKSELLSKRHFNAICGVVSVLERKAWKEVMSLLVQFTLELRHHSVAVHWCFTRSGHPRSVSETKLAEEFLLQSSQAEEGRDALFPGSGPPRIGSARVEPTRVETFQDAEKALVAARQSAGESGLVLVTGSLFLVGEIRELVSSSSFRTIASIEGL